MCVCFWEAVPYSQCLNHQRKGIVVIFITARMSHFRLKKIKGRNGVSVTEFNDSPQCFYGYPFFRLACPTQSFSPLEERIEEDKVSPAGHSSDFYTEY